MSGFNIGNLVQDMINAAAGVCGQKWPLIREYAETEYKKYCETIQNIKRMHDEGMIDEEESRLLLDIQKSAMRSVLLCVEGMGILMVEQAINAAINSIKSVVNTAIGFVLL